MNSPLAKIISFILSGLRPILGPATCKYPIGCLQYTQDELSSQPLFKALYKSIKRILSCISL